MASSLERASFTGFSKAGQRKKNITKNTNERGKRYAGGMILSIPHPPSPIPCLALLSSFLVRIWDPVRPNADPKPWEIKLAWRKEGREILETCIRSHAMDQNLQPPEGPCSSARSQEMSRWSYVVFCDSQFLGRRRIESRFARGEWFLVT